MKLIITSDRYDCSTELLLMLKEEFNAPRRSEDHLNDVKLNVHVGSSDSISKNLSMLKNINSSNYTHFTVSNPLYDFALAV